jgi:signal transduction histidine kinase
MGASSRTWWVGALKALPSVMLVVLIVAVQVGVTIVMAHVSGEVDRVDALAIVLLVAGPLCLLARRRHPIVTLLAIIPVTLLFLGMRYPLGPVYLSLVIAMFNAVLHGPRLPAWLAGWGSIAGVVVVLLVTRDDYQLSVGPVGAAIAWTTSILVVAEIIKARRERAAQAETAMQEQARRLASEERLRIAREVHDVLAHHVSLINVQSGVALHLIDEQPEQAREALTTIKQSSKEVLVELRNILGVLRAVDSKDGLPKHPVASLDQLDALLDRMRSAGLPVGLEVTGEPRSLPSGVDAAALRIVQESLTNTYRHAGPTQAGVRLGYLPGELRIQVNDNGRGQAGVLSTMGSGNGLAGMRQRAEALGGTFAAGPRPTGGFSVIVTLPTARDDGTTA